MSGALPEETLLRLAIESMAQGLFMLDADRRITVLNQRFLDIYSLPRDVIRVGATAYDIVEQSVLAGNYPGLTIQAAWARAAARLDSYLPWRVEQRLGSGQTIAITFAPMPGGGWVTTHLDVTEKRNAEDRLDYLANHDALTGLANRHQVAQLLTPQIEACCPFALMSIDLDRFKAVNDGLGHAAGDELLRQVARRLRDACPDGALVARMGGDEFLVQVTGGQPGRAAPCVAEAVLQTMRAPFLLGQCPAQIGASIGIAIAPVDGNTLDGLLHKADLALYKAKNSGRNRFRIYTQAMEQTITATPVHNVRRPGMPADRRVSVLGKARVRVPSTT